MTARTRYLMVGAAGITVVGTIGVIGITRADADTSTAITGLSGKCVDVDAASSVDGTKVQIFECNDTVAQKWSFHEDGTLRALGKCLDVTGGAAVNGTRTVLYECNGAEAQNWFPRAGALVNTASGKCLDVTDWGRADRTGLQIWTCTGAANQAWEFMTDRATLPHETSTVPTDGDTPPADLETPPAGGETPPTLEPGGGGAAGPGLNAQLPPGGNFDLAVWRLELPTGRPGSPDVIPPAELAGVNGYTNPAYFWTDRTDGAMTFWAPERGVTWKESKYARSELREMNRDGSFADWARSGSHTLSAELRVAQVTRNVCVGQVHLGAGGPSKKPLLELYYRPSGDIYIGVENSPAGGQTLHKVGNVPLGERWAYAINVSGDTINLTVNGSRTSYPIPSSFGPYRHFFQLGAYNQSSSASTTQGARVKFYSVGITHA
ncbi:polysaccharide lyase family 7 protein [Actinoplanes sp. NBRC 101535]|uniref:polysaccharide lyase family 7 protein n=1 Tax=Actinoplanes sp. NBRC 101535 TaxID=3032196 RepID=UPI0025526109|nr:polysaccharide lyase family 7 protein [Actinoplanes sp. NBRC 101535]